MSKIAVLDYDKIITVLLNVILFRPFRAINIVRNLTQGVALGYGN